MEKTAVCNYDDQMIRMNNNNVDRELLDAALSLMLMSRDTTPFDPPTIANNNQFDEDETRRLAANNQLNEDGEHRLVAALPPFPANNGRNDEGGHRNLPEFVVRGIIGECSRPFSKHLTKTDVKDDQARLIMHKEFVEKNFLPLLYANENVEEGIQVKVYDDEGEEYDMKFKLWASKLYVLMHGWKLFRKQYDLKAVEDQVMVWMFRHAFTRELCFAICKRRLRALRDHEQHCL